MILATPKFFVVPILFLALAGSGLLFLMQNEHRPALNRASEKQPDIRAAQSPAPVSEGNNFPETSSSAEESIAVGFAATPESPTDGDSVVAPVSQRKLPLIFVRAEVKAEIILDGVGTNIDSPEFWESPTATDTLLFSTAKSNKLVEVWRYPFRSGEMAPIRFDRLPNGIGIDQDRDWLVVGLSGKEPSVEIYTLPERRFLKRIGRGEIRSGETNVDVYHTGSGETWIYVTEDDAVKAYDADTGKLKVDFHPAVDSVEEVAADSYHKVLYVPDENGILSRANPKGAVLAYHMDGKPFKKNGRRSFATEGMFDGDAEGITIHRCLDEKGIDTGRGYIVVADQADKGKSGYEFFNRETWKHLGTLVIVGASYPDGITATSRPLPNFPKGIFASSSSDKTTVLVGWDTIYRATGISCE